MNAARTTADPRFAGLHVLADDDPRWPIDPVAQGTAACRGGAQVVQLRVKHATDRQQIEWGRALRRVTREHDARFVVNDRFDIALACEADGVHLGQGDLPPRAVPTALRRQLAIGYSTHTLDQARAALEEPIDYLAFGPVFGTTSKESEYSLRGVDLLEEVCRMVEPRTLVAIGGIDVEKLGRVLDTGAQAAAVISAVAAAEDPIAATRGLVSCFATARMGVEEGA